VPPDVDGEPARVVLGSGREQRKYTIAQDPVAEDPAVSDVEDSARVRIVQERRASLRAKPLGVTW
jgi:hypothetical protein